MGSVHHGGFPTVVGNGTVNANNNSAGGIHFDATVDVFDSKVVHEYIDGMGNRGGPLVTSFNESSRSDFRLYESDGNVTMRQFYNQGDDFLNSCVPLMQRMLETVPGGVVLSNIVSPMIIKPVNALTPFGFTSPSSISLMPSFRNALTLSAASDTGKSVFGTTSYFPFTIPITSLSTLQSFTISYSSISSHVFAISFSGAFVVPSLSSLSSDSSTRVNVTIASLEKSFKTPKVVLKVPISQQGTLGPAIRNYELSNLKVVGTKAGFNLWEGNLDLRVLATGSVEVEVFNGNHVADLHFL